MPIKKKAYLKNKKTPNQKAYHAMKIESGELSLSSSQYQTVMDYRRQDLEISRFSSKAFLPQAGIGPARNGGTAIRDSVKISEEARVALRAYESEQLFSRSVVKNADSEMMLLTENSKTVSETMVGAILGLDVNMTRLTVGDQDSGGSRDVNLIQTGEQIQIKYRDYQYQRQEQSTSVSARGFVTTADGREIGFQLSLALDRTWEMAAENTMLMEGRMEALVDPLTITLYGPSPELSDAKFQFDLDADGDMEYISHLKPGSGFLVFDKNADGVINDGSEMFGTQTGNGFAELSVYDRDENGWIDENDAIYDKLKIWVRDSTGADRLMSLRDAGVGAISVDGIASKFDMKDEANNLHGSIRSTGIYLTEDGMARTVQQIDLAAADPVDAEIDTKGMTVETGDEKTRDREEMREFMEVMRKMEQMRMTAREETRRLMEKGHGPSERAEKAREPKKPYEILLDMIEDALETATEKLNKKGNPVNSGDNSPKAMPSQTLKPEIR